MYAVIETGGKQYRVTEGDVIQVEKLKVEAGDTIEFDKVLMLNDGSEVLVGAPYLNEKKVFGSVVENGKAQKVIIFKYKSKKDYRKKQGHRQPYTMVEITSLTGEAKAPAKKAVPAETAEAAEAEKKPAAKKPAAEKKTVAKKAAEDKPAAEKKPAAKKRRKEMPISPHYLPKFGNQVQILSQYQKLLRKRDIIALLPF